MVVTVPLKNYRDVPVEPLAGKIVIDTNNYYFERDGHIAELDEERTTVSQMLQEHLPTSRSSRVQQHPGRGAHHRRHPRRHPRPRALPVAGDDAEAKALVTTLLDEFGFDAVDAGSLAESWRFERDRPAYVPADDRRRVPVKLAEAVRGA